MELIQQWGLGWKHLFQTMVTWQPLERSSLYQALAWAVVSVTLGSLLLSDSRNVGTVPGPGGASAVTPRYREERVPQGDAWPHSACAQAKEI